MDLNRQLIYCPSCEEFLSGESLDSEGRHCGAPPYEGTAGVIFRLLSLDSIPSSLLALGAGNLNTLRMKIADAMWPATTPPTRPAAHARGISPTCASRSSACGVPFRRFRTRSSSRCSRRTD